MCVNGTYFTSPDSSNLLLTVTTMDQYKAEIEKDMADKDFARFCPQTAPYSIGNKCHFCPDNKPYFSIDYLECQNC